MKSNGEEDSEYTGQDNAVEWTCEECGTIYITEESQTICEYCLTIFGMHIITLEDLKEDSEEVLVGG